MARNRAGERVTLDSLLADERELGYGAGISFVGTARRHQALGTLMRDFGPVTFRCARASACASCARPIGFCNPYFDGRRRRSSDLSDAGALVDFFDLAAPARGARRDQRSGHGAA